MVGISDIEGMTAAEKADLFAAGARKLLEGRYQATITLAALQRSNGYLDLKCRTVEELARKWSKLGPREVSEMLWVGRKLFEIPELNRAFKDQRLCWTKVKTLVPHITQENATAWIAKAIRLSSGDLQRQISNHRDPCFGGGPMQVLLLSLPGYERFEQLANGLRAEAGDKHLTNEECFMRLLDEVEAARKARRTAARASGAVATTSAPVPAATDAGTVPPAAEEPVVPVEECANQSRHIPAAIRREVMNRARHACEVCRNRHGLEVHHVKGFRKGGPHAPDNLEVLCHACHEKQHRAGRRGATPPVAACEPTVCATAPERHDEDRGGEQGEAPAGNSLGVPSSKGNDLACPLGQVSPARESPRTHREAGDEPGEKIAGELQPGGQ